jgi:hypothetical protein
VAAWRYCWCTAEGCCKPAAWAAGSMRRAAMESLSMAPVFLCGVAAIIACCGGSCTKGAQAPVYLYLYHFDSCTR